MTLISHLRGIEVSATDPAALLAFYEDTWGLQRVAETPDGGVLLRAHSPEHHVFALVPGDGHTLTRITLGAPSLDAVDAVAARVLAAGGTVEQPPARSTEPGGGYRTVVRDPEGRRIEVSAGLAEHDEPPARTEGPDRLSHIVLNSTDMGASKSFYTDVLGFQVSDWYENDQMVFLRCNEMHHCIVLTPGRWTSLNHVAFEVASGDEVMRALGRMRRAGYDSMWGPGRHGPGGNVFCYFVDPAGNVIEYTAELLVLDDAWQAKSWVRNAENADVWGTSGGITPEVIAAMANPPASART